ncbi:MAG: hypothetical protein A2277_02020 [Desulfobacterales bacterium RIFOXYA12_FULL_46_15]|nr:MAG: hypothetical protein A2277_02020 [Desulfobacterales bacterium RIFOXYA12_FULL_46_15]
MVTAIFITSCGEKKKSQAELTVGNWSQEKNRAYVLLYANSKGEWNSSVKVSEATSKVVKTKGKAKGLWRIEKNQMIFTVMESDIEDVWEKNSTVFYDILDLTENKMQLKDEQGDVTAWSRTKIGKSTESEADLALVIPMAPVVVNLNKDRSNDKDRYLCLKMNFILKELMPGQQVPPVHPKVEDAIVIFFSSLVFEDVKDFDGIRSQGQKLVNILNPYMEGMIKEVAIENVIVATEIEKVEEFLIEHTPPADSAPEEGKQAKDEKKKKDGKEKPKDKKG